MYCQLVDQVCYLQALIIVFVAVKTFSGVFVPQGVAAVFLRVEPLVLYIPLASGRFCQLADVVCSYYLIGEPYKSGRWILLLQWLVGAAIAGDCFCAAEPPGHLAVVVKWQVYPLIMAVDVGFAFHFGVVGLQASAVSVLVSAISLCSVLRLPSLRTTRKAQSFFSHISINVLLG